MACLVAGLMLLEVLRRLVGLLRQTHFQFILMEEIMSVSAQLPLMPRFQSLAQKELLQGRFTPPPQPTPLPLTHLQHFQRLLPRLSLLVREGLPQNTLARRHAPIS